MRKLLSILMLACVSHFTFAQSTFIVDGGHSSVVFSIDYNFTEFYGSFASMEGKVELKDNNDFSTANVSFTIDVTSIKTNNSTRDEHLQGERYLKANEYTQATFVSKSVKKLDNNTYEMTGDMTIAGKTLSETVLVKVLGKGKSERAGVIMGVKATFAFNRSNYGIGGGIPVMSDKTNVIASLQLVEDTKAKAEKAEEVKTPTRDTEKAPKLKK